MNYKKPQSTIVHGGTGIYPLTTADQVILADGSRLEKDGKINVDSAANASKMGGKAPEYYIQLRNLLDNSDFRNPVNQRGQTSYTGQVYGIDRWYGGRASQKVGIRNTDVTVTATSSSYAGIKQKIANIDRLSGKTVTLATYVYSTVGVAVGFTDGNDNTVSETVDNRSGSRVILCTYTVPSNATPDTFIPIILLRTTAQNDYMRCYWAALYEGSYTADTLPPYVPKGYAAELAECRRYYKRFNSPNDAIICAGYVTDSTTKIYINALDNYPMRINKPSCRFSGNITVRGINGYIAQDYSDVVIRVYANATGCISMIEIARGDSAAWNATNNTPLFVTINANSVFELIADL